MHLLCNISSSSTASSSLRVAGGVWSPLQRPANSSKATLRAFTTATRYAANLMLMYFCCNFLCGAANAQENPPRAPCLQNRGRCVRMPQHFGYMIFFLAFAHIMCMCDSQLTKKMEWGVECNPFERQTLHSNLIKQTMNYLQAFHLCALNIPQGHGSIPSTVRIVFRTNWRPHRVF